ncbi:hypothetical protein GCM10025867_29340 [Frondihabitans sucicola]|uniref:AbiEi antitoxin C-terminal domain-containing protein n=1 Tax=Frondihabitans sucicola TaxID=1268041 RepID=A0ABM8GQI8_9MICO|nr:hypothetical protein [Frondihabitans sucicola]BDZ50693.1 hypothetical protein GCM10025867_29340 [Frondihabitans sucicola]
MTSSLPRLLTTRDLPHAELQAAALDGDVFRVDRAFCSVAEFDVPWRRASALEIPESLVLAGRSAAWVWGAQELAPIQHEALRVGPGRHVGATAGYRVSAAVVDPGDIVDFGPVRVTGPTRTVVDLCRADGYDDEVVDVVRRLVSEHRVGRAGCSAVLERARPLPHSRRTRARLEALHLG